LVLVHPLPAGSRITVAELGIARQYAVHRVEILTAECRVVWTMSLDGLVRPATIAVTDGPTVEFRPGDAPRLDDRPVTVQECGGSTEPEPGRSPSPSGRAAIRPHMDSLGDPVVESRAVGR
jgi:hypothetical protein